MAQTQNQKKLLKILSEMFQLDQSDLDFGIYRIMNSKSKEIQEFLENDLISSIKDAFSSNDNSSIQKELDEAIKQAQSLGADPETLPKVKELREKLSSTTSSSNLENEVFSHLATFFSRYYKNGDFVSLRRYKKDTYAIPYEGEEVKLHWANSDQYYIKSGEYFRDYSFKVGDKTIHFKLKEAQTEQNNNKAISEKERRFVIFEDNLCEIIDDELYINFEYKAVGKVKQDKLNEEAISKALETLGNGGFSPEINEAKAIGSEFVTILNTLAPTEKKPKRTIFEKHLKNYTSRNSFDYFIHKDLGGFLNRELDFYVKNEMLFIDDIMDSPVKYEEVMNKVKIFKSVAQKIIAFLTQLEELQKKLWEKKKFVIETNYCITLDKIPEEYYEEILVNEKQKEEWKKLFDVEVQTLEDLKEEKYLVLDTKFFSKEFKYKLLSEFDNLDVEIDGVLINSENFGALNLLQKRYKEQIKTVYIDPPYNTGDDGFLYVDNYRESSWLSLMENRLSIAKPLLKTDGAMFISIDDRELFNLKKLMEQIYNEYASKTIAIKMAEPTGKKMASVIKTGSLPKLKEYGLIFKKNKVSGFDFERIPKDKWDNEYKTLLLNISKEEIDFIKNIRENEDYTNNNLKKIDDILEKVEFTSLSLYGKQQNIKIDDEWKYDNAWRIVRDASLEGNAKLLADEKNITCKGAYQIITPQKKMYFIKAGYNMNVSSPRIKLLFADDYLTLHCGDFWSDIKTTGLDNEGYVEFLNGKKPLKLIKRFLTSIIKNNDVVFDFFAGSGTTGHAVIQININNQVTNKFILCEQGEYFENKLKFRLINTIYKENYSSIIKYFKLESYEDTLNNLEFKRTKEQDKALELYPQAKEDYMLNYSLNVESQSSLLNIDNFTSPFNYKLKIATSSVGETKDTNIDLVETFNYLLGLVVKRTELIKGYLVVEGQNLKGEKIIIIWRNGQSSEELNEFFEKMDWSVYDREFDTIYVNGDNNLANLKKDEDNFKVKLIEQEFKNLMFGE